jgi:hypothetical protein
MTPENRKYILEIFSGAYPPACVEPLANLHASLVALSPLVESKDLKVNVAAMTEMGNVLANFNIAAEKSGMTQY